jgi:hypothetical protein
LSSENGLCVLRLALLSRFELAVSAIVSRPLGCSTLARENWRWGVSGMSAKGLETVPGESWMTVISESRGLEDSVRRERRAREWSSASESES